MWRPIESAPKDGTFILVYGELGGSLPPIGSCKFGVVHWVDGFNGWYLDGDEYTLAPTHWMPLPSAPVG
jgi:uncharacterized protein DUF551